MLMQRIKYTLMVLGFLGVSLTGVIAQDAASDVAKMNHTLMHATGPYEDMVGPALAKNKKDVAALLATADKEADSVKQALPAEAAKQFDTLLKAIHQAADAKDNLALAKNSVAVFRLLVDHLKADALKIPLEVSLLDWAGYELQVLASADKPDWSAMNKVAADSETWWKAMSTTKVPDKHLRATMTSAIRGIKQAIQEKNLTMVKFAAQMDLDLVDVVEDTFKTKAPPKPN
ncbi:MAG: hypothetical protein JWQ71_2284 [Pedosphaera sp.]|nr:hypothetical protein [Pedosphaera sp.]